MKNIFVKSILGLFAVSIVSIGAYAIFQDFKRSILSSVREDLLHTIVEQSRESTRIFTTSHAMLRGLAQDESVIRFLTTTGENRPTREAIEEILGHYNIQDYPSIYLIATSGLCVAATDQTGKFLGNNYTFRDYFQKAIKGVSWTDMAMGSTTIIPGYFFSEPIRDHDGNIIGVAVAKLDGSVIDASVTSSISKTLHGDVLIVDSDGVIISTHSPERIFKTLAPLESTRKEELLAKNKFRVPDLISLDLNDVQEAIRLYDSPVTVDYVDPKDGKEKIVAIQKMSESPFYLLMEVDQTTVFLSSGERMFGTILFILLGIFLILILVGFSVRNRFTLLKLSQSTLLQEKLEQAVVEKTAELLSSNAVLQDEVNQRKKAEEELLHSNKELKKFNTMVVDRELKMIELKKEIGDLRKKTETT